MSQYEIPFYNYAIREFANRFQMSRLAAYNYLRNHNGMSFLTEFYDVEHLQDIDETVDDLIIKCQQTGGQLA